MVPDDENDQEQIIPDRKEEKRGIQDSKNDKSERAKMKEKRNKIADEGVHAQLTSPPNARGPIR